MQITALKGCPDSLDPLLDRSSSQAIYGKYGKWIGFLGNWTPTTTNRGYHRFQYQLSETKFLETLQSSMYSPLNQGQWGRFNSQEKLKTMLMQNFGVTNKEHYGMLWYFLEWSMATAQVVRFSFCDVTMAKLIRINKLPSSTPPLSPSA